MSSTFSYAQAAKGQSMPLPSAPQSVVSQSGSSISSQSRDTPAASVTGESSSAISRASNDVDAMETMQKPSCESDLVDKINADMDTQADTERLPLHRSVVEASQAVSTDARKQAANSMASSTERRSKNSSSSARASESADSKKSRKGKKSKNAEKDLGQDQAAEKEKESPIPEAKLTEAPIPVVNPWLKRLEASKAKAPSVLAAPLRSSTDSDSATTVTVSSKPGEARAQSSTEEGAENVPSLSRQTPNGIKKEGRSNHNSDQPARRAAPRGSKVAERNEKAIVESLPSVADISSWPTPDSAATELRVQDKVERLEEKDESKEESRQEQASKKEKTQWVSMPYVPSVNFQTPLPSRGGRGGRSSGRGGGRETSGRGNHLGSGPTDRSQAASGAKSASSSQERRSDAGSSGRSPSIPPHAAKQTPNDSRKSAEASAALAGGNHTQINGKTAPFEPAQSANSVAVDQEATTSNPSTFPSQQTESDAWKDAASQVAKESAYQGSSRGEGGPRTRGSHRGRGGHGNVNGPGHHAHTSFATNGQYSMGGNMGPRSSGFPGYPGMPYGNQYPASNGPSGRAAAGRSNSVGQFNRSHSNGSRHPRAPHVQTTGLTFDPSMPAPLTGPPFYPEANQVLTLIKGQLRYYFSIDNLCKDMFLREHMDSQGYVIVDVILNFKRMRDLQADHNLIRLACQEMEEVELVYGKDDQRLRVRPRKGWEQWVREKESRQSVVQHDDGLTDPIVLNPLTQVHMIHNSPYAVQQPQGFFPDTYAAPYPHFGAGDLYAYGYNNGMSGHAATGDSQMSGAAIPFLPGPAPQLLNPEQSTLTNGITDNVEGHSLPKSEVAAVNDTQGSPSQTQNQQPQPLEVNGDADAHAADSH